MAKAVRMGVGTSLPLIKSAAAHPPAGIIIGTANGGMEESVKFLKQIIEYNEDMLTPGNFVQSIPNAISSQISLLSKNKGYNTTHVHRGLAFENAVIDAAMMLRENPANSYLVGGVDEIATYHYNLENLAGSYKKEVVSSQHLYDTDSPGSIAGEGAAMFLVGNEKEQAMAVKTNSKDTAGPPLALALPIVLKIPAPIMAEMARAVKSRRLRFRRNVPPTSFSR